MTDALSKLIIQYNEFMDLCQEFHSQSGIADAEARAEKIGEISRLFTRISKLDEESGNLLEARHYLGIAGELGRIARRFGA